MAKLQSLLRDRGVRQSELAGHLDVSEPSVSRWANGAADIPARYIQPIASFIGVPVADVVAVAVRADAPQEAKL